MSRSVEEKEGQLVQFSGIQMPGMRAEKPDDAIARDEVSYVLWLIDVMEINRLQHLARPSSAGAA